MSLLEVADLHTHFIARGLDNRIRTARALNGVSFTLDAGRTLGLVGETGAGKSLTALSIMGLLRPPARIVAGSIRFEGRDLVGASDAELNALRGGSIALIVQSPRTSLDPLTRVGDQLIAVHRAHRQVDAAAAREHAIAMLTSVGIPDPARRMAAWPHELSGGMAQRILIALVLALEPDLVVADEPTTNLDNIVERQILTLFRGLRDRIDAAFIFITHDMTVAAELCDRIAVMYAGQIVEIGPTRAVFEAPRHPYTQGLIATATALKHKADRLQEIAGELPNLASPPPGCLFAPRCPRVMDRCRAAPPPSYGAEPHRTRCYLEAPA